MRPGDTCYQCDAPAVNVEHVPPKVFVPHAKRKGAFDHLPSCFAHNSARSLDDQYTAMTMALITPAAYDDPKYIDVVARTLDRQNRALGKKIGGTMRDANGALTLTHDVDRTGRVFGDIAAALYFLETGAKACGKPFVSTQGAHTETSDPEIKRNVVHNPAVRMLQLVFQKTEAYPVRARDHSVLWYQVAPAGAVRFYLNESVENVVIWPWCDLGRFFDAGAASVQERRENPKFFVQLLALANPDAVPEPHRNGVVELVASLREVFGPEVERRRSNSSRSRRKSRRT